MYIWGFDTLFTWYWFCEHIMLQKVSFIYILVYTSFTVDTVDIMDYALHIIFISHLITPKIS